MRQLQPDRSIAWNSPSQPLRLRWEIECNRRRLLEIDQLETSRVLVLLSQNVARCRMDRGIDRKMW